MQFFIVDNQLNIKNNAKILAFFCEKITLILILVVFLPS